MKISVGNWQSETATYTQCRNLAFSPEIDMSGDSLPVNTFSVEILTSDRFTLGQQIILKSDDNAIWANYCVTEIEYIDTGYTKVVGSAPIALNKGDIPEGYYDNESISSILENSLSDTQRLFRVDDAYREYRFSGYHEAMPTREVMAQLLFCMGATLKTWRDWNMIIEPIDTGEGVLIPFEKTFYKPKIRQLTPKGSIYITEYGPWLKRRPEDLQPGEEEKNFQIGDVCYVYSGGVYYRVNSSYPSGDRVSIDNVYLTDDASADAACSRMAPYYFSEMEVEAEVIDDGEYMPGMKVHVYTDESTIVTGWISRAAFTFGARHNKAKITLVGCYYSELGGTVTLKYIWEGVGTLLETERVYPKDYTYRHATKYLDKTISGHRYIFRPTVEYINIISTVADQTVTINCAPALDFYEGCLHIFSVDALDTATEQEGGETVTAVVID